MKGFLSNRQKQVMSRGQVRSFDKWAITRLGIPSAVLMENAGRSCAEFIKNKLRDLHKAKVCLFCGTGNNGGDGYVVARHLLNSDFDVTVVLCGDYAKIKGDARINLRILEQMQACIQQVQVPSHNLKGQVGQLTGGTDMIVDGLFGTGLKGKLKDGYIELIESINALKIKILAIDVPSGLDCDTAKPLGTAIRASFTVTFAAIKKGFLYETAKQFTGEIQVASIGIHPRFMR